MRAALALSLLVACSQRVEGVKSVKDPASCAVPPALADKPGERSVLAKPLRDCSPSNRAGYSRSGRCSTGPDDVGVHVVCAQMTERFLTFTQAHGNDLATPRPELDFPGLRPGERWCLCVDRWKEALEAGFAPPVILEATHAQALNTVSLKQLEQQALP